MKPYQRYIGRWKVLIPKELDKLIHKMDRLQRQFEALDGYGLESQIEKILPENGI
jgi:ATP-binding cassette subfamily F protein 3